jgi:hypothetical protein
MFFDHNFNYVINDGFSPTFGQNLTKSGLLSVCIDFCFDNYFIIYFINYFIDRQRIG